MAKTEIDLKKLEALEATQKKLDKIMKSYNKELGNSDSYLEKQTHLWGDISRTIIGVNSEDFYQKIKLSTEEMENLADHAEGLRDAILDTTASLSKDFSTSISKNKGEILAIAQDYRGISKGFSKSMVEAVQTGDLSKLLDKYGISGLEKFNKLVKSSGHKMLSDSGKDYLKSLKGQEKSLAKINKQQKEVL